jgi:hypothetical protein
VDDLGNLFVAGGAGQTLSADSDDDDLTNEAEVLMYLTNPRHFDSDADDISDYLEASETPLPANLPLASWGADPNHKDLWLEFDWMAPGPTPPPSGAAPTYAPNPTSFQAVADMFEVSPLTNPDGVTGVKLHIDAGPTRSVNFAPTPTWYGGGSEFPYVECGSSRPNAGSLAPTYMKDHDDREHVFCYAVRRQHCSTDPGGWAHRDSGSFNIYADPDLHWRSLAQGIVHEYGHVMGLGFPEIQEHPCTNTVMRYEVPYGLDVDGDGLFPREADDVSPFPVDLDEPSFKLDYSHGEYLSIDESSVDETRGHLGPDRPVDFNFNGRIDTVPFQLSFFKEEDWEFDDTYEDEDEWSNLSLGIEGPYGPGAPPTATPTPTP